MSTRYTYGTVDHLKSRWSESRGDFGLAWDEGPAPAQTRFMIGLGTVILARPSLIFIIFFASVLWNGGGAVRCLDDLKRRMESL